MSIQQIHFKSYLRIRLRTWIGHFYTCPFPWCLWILCYTSISSCLQNRRTQPMFRASCCDTAFQMMPWNVSHMYKCNLALLFCFSCFAVVDQREVSGSKHLWFNVPDVGILSFCFFLSVPILFQSVVASRDSEFEARISREWPACCGLGGGSVGMVARIFCCPEYRAMIMVWLCRNLLDYFFNHSKLNSSYLIPCFQVPLSHRVNLIKCIYF